MDTGTALAQLLERLQAAVADGSFVKLTLGAYRGGDPTLRNVFVRPVELKTGRQLQFVYRHATKDVTKNLAAADALPLIGRLVGAEFGSAHLFTTRYTADWKQGARKLKLGKPQHATVADPRHDRVKHRWIDPAAQWLQALGPTPDKIRQIDKFVEVLKSVVEAAGLSGMGSLSAEASGEGVISPVRSPVGHASRVSASPSLRLVDMGCGKGYLTFAAYEWLTRHGWPDAVVTGVEARTELVALCNGVAQRSGFAGLTFQAGEIESYQATDGLDLLVALHACDTATDDALAQGIAAGARAIIVAPCCHKELRPQLEPPAVLAEALRHGILRERQAEFVTDALRAGLLEWAGYETKVFEFISTEHTAKNLMLTATRSGSERWRWRAELCEAKSGEAKFGGSAATGFAELRPPAPAARVRDLARFYGIRQQRLARKLGFAL